MNLRHIFKDIPPGSVCTATVHTFDLDHKKLIKRGVLTIENRHVTDAKQNHDEYVFLGFPQPEENEFDNPEFVSGEKEEK